jgi:hypothetical protein
VDSYPIVPVGGLAGLVIVSTGSVGDGELIKLHSPPLRRLRLDALVLAA